MLGVNGIVKGVVKGFTRRKGWRQRVVKGGLRGVKGGRKRGRQRRDKGVGDKNGQIQKGVPPVCFDSKTGLGHL